HEPSRRRRAPRVQRAVVRRRGHAIQQEKNPRGLLRIDDKDPAQSPPATRQTRPAALARMKKYKFAVASDEGSRDAGKEAQDWNSNTWTEVVTEEWERIAGNQMAVMDGQQIAGGTVGLKAGVELGIDRRVKPMSSKPETVSNGSFYLHPFLQKCYPVGPLAREEQQYCYMFLRVFLHSSSVLPESGAGRNGCVIAKNYRLYHA
ncbi:hypothetical protein R3P38DRAFT_3444422, partial [Favolaschia claudopus]